MERIREMLEGHLTKDLHQVVLSKVKGDKTFTKGKIRPLLLHGNLFFQIAETRLSKEYHKNLKKEEMIEEILTLLKNQFVQLELEDRGARINILVSKKGKVTIKSRNLGRDETGAGRKEPDLQHDRAKDYILPVGEPVDFLVALGLMTGEGRIVKGKHDKFRQINRFLEFIEDVLPALPRDRELKILDFGCGKSYLTFAIYYYLHVKKGYDIQAVGLDLKEDVIRDCRALAERCGYKKLTFAVGDIGDYQGSEAVDMVVSLHACDTATDFALAQAVKWNASVILSVPCCQHEANKQIANNLLEPIFHYGILQERIAALITDGIRGQLLEEAGYESQILEFIDMEHTPKNLLIRAVKRSTAYKKKEDLHRCIDGLHLKLTLEELLKKDREGMR